MPRNASLTMTSKWALLCSRAARPSDIRMRSLGLRGSGSFSRASSAICGSTSKAIWEDPGRPHSMAHGSAQIPPPTWATLSGRGLAQMEVIAASICCMYSNSRRPGFVWSIRLCSAPSTTKDTMLPSSTIRSILQSLRPSAVLCPISRALVLWVFSWYGSSMSVSPRDSHVRKDWGTDDSGAPILHVDMDSFFASVEVALDPRIAGLPLVVGGTSGRGVVTSCTYDVRAKGVHAGMPISQAKALAPEALFIRGRRGEYVAYSQRVMAILEKYTPVMEPASIDEAYLDVSGARRMFGTPLEIGQKLRAEIKGQLHLPASVGIAATKTVAKIASAHAKPDGILLIPKSATLPFLHSLPIGALPGVGKRTAQTLELRGILTLGDLARWDEADLEKAVGQAAAVSLQERARGIDKRRVGSEDSEKSISTEETFQTNLTSPAQVEAYLNQAAWQCASRLRKSGLLAWTIQIKLRDAKFRTITRSHTLDSPTDVARDIAAFAVRLFGKVVFPVGGVRLAGVGVQGLVSVADGFPVPLDSDPRPRATESAADGVHEKFGYQALGPASSLGRPWDIGVASSTRFE